MGITLIHMIPDGFGFSEHIADGLRSRGFRVEIVLRGKDLPADAETIVYLKGAQIFYDLDDAVAINDDLFAAAKCVANAMTERGGTFISVQNTGGRFGFNSKINELQAASSGAPALLKTAALEWPLANVKAIDFELPEDASLHQTVADRITDEICRVCSDQIEVGLVDDDRFVFELTQTPAISENQDAENLRHLQLDENDIVLASGGGRGVTSECLLELARRCHCKFILLGRTVLEEESERISQATTDAEIKKAIILDAKEEGRLIKPNEVGEKARSVHSGREIRHTLQVFSDAGAEAKYLSADICNIAAVGDAFAKLPDEWKKISVLIHGAGVLADKRIEEKSRQQFDSVFETKINGFYVLKTVLEKFAGLKLNQLKAIVFFSSAAARSGNQGQSDYAMANEVLNKLAESISNDCHETIVKSMGWGPWRGGMVNDSLVSYFENKGIHLIELKDGVAAFADELLHADRTVEVCFGEVDFSRMEESEAPAIFLPKEENFDLEKVCSLQRFPWLEDHSVKGDPLMPMTGVMEWMMEAGTMMFGDVPAWRFDEVAIRQGIRIPKGTEATFQILGKYLDSNGGVDCEVIDKNSHSLHYRATLRPVERVVKSDQVIRKRDEWRKTIYDGEALFHQGVFQSLQSVFNVRDHSIFGELRNLSYATDKIGTEGPRLIALDACLQLLLLWIKANMNGIALPMSIEMATISNETWPVDNVTISATIEHRGAKHAKASAEVQDLSGRTYAVLKGIQSYIY